MKSTFDTISFDCSKLVTQTYSTSFSLATKMLGKGIRQHIYNIYGFVRFADEIVDSFHDYDKQILFDHFDDELNSCLISGISMNPILNSFQHTVTSFGIDRELIDAFMESMRLDLHKKKYHTQEEYKRYIYGSADVVGLMCLKVFVHGDQQKYEELKDSAMALGSALQKVNFLRDLKADHDQLSRCYFPDTDLDALDEHSKLRIITEIENDFSRAYAGIKKLPSDSRFGVYTAYRYYLKLLCKLKSTPSRKIKQARIRVPNYQKFGLLAKSYLSDRLNMI